jgi:outer membrane protein assembly factor BamB
LPLLGTRLYTEGTVGEKTSVWCLDAATGKVVWQADNKIKTDAYGLAAAPLILGEQVIVAAGGHLYLRGAKHLFCLEEGAK